MSLARTCCAPFCIVLSMGCDGEKKLVWSQFNGTDDALRIDVGGALPAADPVVCDDGLACIELHSRVQDAVVGDATVEPSSGPVGTEHRVIVVVGDEWADLVDRVTVAVDGNRGVGIFVLERDPANIGAWGLSLESLGLKNEAREDVWTVELWQSIFESEATITQTMPVTTRQYMGDSPVRPVGAW